MTSTEVETEFELQPGTVRQYLNRHTEIGRKADGRTWLVNRRDAEAIWRK